MSRRVVRHFSPPAAPRGTRRTHRVACLVAVKYLPTVPGVWKPWKGLTAVPSARTEAGVTAAQVKAFEAEMLTLNAIAARAAGVATPVGHSVETWGSPALVAGACARTRTSGPTHAADVRRLTFGVFPDLRVPAQRQDDSRGHGRDAPCSTSSSTRSTAIVRHRSRRGVGRHRPRRVPDARPERRDRRPAALRGCAGRGPRSRRALRAAVARRRARDRQAAAGPGRDRVPREPGGLHGPTGGGARIRHAARAA